jgi:adenosylmethionine-8-amino-7-oxononanoate aminotransferase
LCDAHGVLLIADEIAVGFGRTGSLFACEQGNITPDFLLLSKGLTGGMLPLSAVLTTQRVYDAFYAEHAAQKAFLHSHSYTGNPLACSAALAVLRTFADEPIIEGNRITAARMAALAAPLAALPHVAQVRQTGMILAIELAADARTRKPFESSERRGLCAYRHALSRGVLLRPLGEVLYWMPPYCVGEDELSLLAQVTREAIEVACA